MKPEIEDGMGFSGLAPTRAEREQDRRDQAERKRIKAMEARIRELEVELESWKVRHQDEVNARVNAENDLYAMGQERRREHDLRVKFAGAVEAYRKLLRSVRETLYCTKMAPHEYDADHHCSACGNSSAFAKDLIDNALAPQELRDRPDREGEYE